MTAIEIEGEWNMTKGKLKQNSELGNCSEMFIPALSHLRVSACICGFN
jgi:hypothetical protein